MRQLILMTLISFSLYLNAQNDRLRFHVDSIQTNTNYLTEIIDKVEKKAEFPGGQDSLKAFINHNNKWRVGQETINGKVYIEFVIEKNGSISNIKIIKGLLPTCNEEAEKIVKLMPNWNPGELRGIPVRTKIVLPITFNGTK